MYCKVCGSKLDENATQCHYCGCAIQKETNTPYNYINYKHPIDIKENTYHKRNQTYSLLYNIQIQEYITTSLYL